MNLHKSRPDSTQQLYGVFYVSNSSSKELNRTLVASKSSFLDTKRSFFSGVKSSVHYLSKCEQT